MTQCWEEIRDIAGTRDPWAEAKQIIGDTRVTLGPQASQQWLEAPEHLAMVLARYRAAAALIGRSLSVFEVGCGEGIGASILAKNREMYHGIDTDTEAIGVANDTLEIRPRVDRRRISFSAVDLFECADDEPAYDAVVALDVIEHVPIEQEHPFVSVMAATTQGQYGVCVIGTPSQHAEHLASPQSKAGHVNLYTPERLRDLMARHFHVVQMLYMQDTSIHLGHPGMAHYILGVGIGPR